MPVTFVLPVRLVSVILSITLEVISHFSDMRDMTSCSHFLHLCTAYVLDTSVKSQLKEKMYLSCKAQVESPYTDRQSLFWDSV